MIPRPLGQLSLIALAASAFSLLVLSYSPWWRIQYTLPSNQSLTGASFSGSYYITLSATLLDGFTLEYDTVTRHYRQCQQIDTLLAYGWTLRNRICTPLVDALSAFLILALVGHGLLMLSYLVSMLLPSSRLPKYAIAAFSVCAFVGVSLVFASPFVYFAYLPSSDDRLAFLKVFFTAFSASALYDTTDTTSAPGPGFIYYVCASFVAVAGVIGYGVSLCVSSRYRRADPSIELGVVPMAVPKPSFKTRGETTLVETAGNPLFVQIPTAGKDATFREATSSQQLKSPTSVGTRSPRSSMPQRTDPASVRQFAQGPTFSDSYYYGLNQQFAVPASTSSPRDRSSPPQPREVRRDSPPRPTPQRRALTFDPPKASR
jgi:hypothetical protein